MSTTFPTDPGGDLQSEGEAARHRERDGGARRSAEREPDAAEASRDRFAFLAEVSRCLAESLDSEATLATVAGMSLPYLGAWCIVDVCTGDGGIRRLAVTAESGRRFGDLDVILAEDLASRAALAVDNSRLHTEALEARQAAAAARGIAEAASRAKSEFLAVRVTSSARR